MAKKFKLKQEHLVWIIGILFVMSIMPGEGEKAASQQAIVATEYSCSVDTDCPTCTGGGFAEINETAEDEFTFFQELSYAKCDSGTCRLSEYCLIWDCGNLPVETCQSVKQTMLDNTLAKLNENPMLFFGIIALVVALLLL